MPRVALVFHHGRSEAIADAHSLAAWMGSLGCDVRVPASIASMAGLDELSMPDELLGEGADVAVCLGGDGSMLRTISLVADHCVPVLGINYGSLGYLTVVEASGAHEAVERVLAGDYEVETRMRIEVARDGAEPASLGRALNESIVEKVESGRTVACAVTIDGEPWMHWAADGVVVCTPTGSTAYSLSAGGPIVAPTHEALVVTPVAPHSLFDRSLVLPPSSEIRVEVQDDRPAAVALDGRTAATLRPGESMVCTASDRPAQLVTFGGREFQAVVMRKFRLNAR